MRSNTLIPLKEFTDWLGIPAFKAAGIDYDNQTITPPTRSNYNTDYCIYQHPWIDRNNWSRDDIEDLLAFAESVFISFAGFYPSLYQINSEIQSYSKTKNIRTGRFTYPSFIPKFSVCCDIHFGKTEFHEIDVAAIVDKGSPLEDIFTISVTIPVDVDVDQIRVFEAGYIPEDFNDKTHELRPLKYERSGNTVTITGPAYLFIKRDLLESESCLEHDEDTYDDTVGVYYYTVDATEQGNFITFLEDKHQISIRRKYIGTNNIYGQPVFTDPKCMSDSIQAVEYHYLTGYEGSINDIKNIIFKLAIGLSDCIKNWSECEICAKQKIEHYKNVAKTKSAANVTHVSKQDDSFEILMTQEILNMYPGFIPNVGFLQAIAEIKLLRCNNVFGGAL